MLFPEMIWIHDPEPHSAALNMAIDEVLLLGVRQPLFRTYRWDMPAVSFGYFGKIDEIEKAWPSRVKVRRWTGGGVVPHGEDFTYTLVIPRGDPLAAVLPGESYRLIHEQIATAFQEFNSHVELAPVAMPKISGACFENPAQHDILRGSEKVAGAAQRRTREGLLHQGSIQMPGLAGTFVRSLAKRLSHNSQVRELTEAELHQATEIAAAKYATDAWLRRF